MKKRSLKENLGLSLRGILMGSADVVPGVSGGTIAFITGIYQELLDSISSLNLVSLQLLLKGKFKEFWTAINGTFFAFLLSGVFVSILTLAEIISSIVEDPTESKEKVILWAFFFGLIIASSIYVGKQVKTWSLKNIAALLLGTCFAFFITIASPATGSDANWYIFLAGFIAICAMILPGISGSFILLLMGAYPIVLGSIKDLIESIKLSDIELLKSSLTTVSVFGIGCIIGLLSFARLVSFLFKKAPSITMAVLTGFLIGSLNKVWPWKNTIEYRTNSSNEQVPYLQENLLPSQFTEIHQDNYLIMAISCSIIGFIVVFGIEWLGAKMNTDTNE